MHVHGLSRHLGIALGLNLAFCIVEFIGGALTDSVAIWSDAVHDLGDALAIALALWLERYSQKASDKKYSFGYRRFSSLSALIVSTVLVIGALLILQQAIPRLWNPQAVHQEGVMGLAILGILVNGFAAWKLNSGPKSQNQRAVTLHMVEDLLGWVAVFIGGVLMYFTNWYIVDPILSIVIAFFIFYNALKNAKGILKILLQATPPGIDFKALEAAIANTKGVEETHDVQVWSIDGEQHVLSCHVVLENGYSLEKATSIKEHIRKSLKELNISHITIEIEDKHAHG